MSVTRLASGLSSSLSHIGVHDYPRHARRIALATLLAIQPPHSANRHDAGCGGAGVVVWLSC